MKSKDHLFALAVKITWLYDTGQGSTNFTQLIDTVFYFDQIAKFAEYMLPGSGGNRL